MTVAEMMAKLATLPPEWPVRVFDNHTGDELEIEAVDTAEALDVDVADTPEGNRVVFIRAEE